MLTAHRVPSLGCFIRRNVRTDSVDIEVSDQILCWNGQHAVFVGRGGEGAGVTYDDAWGAAGCLLHSGEKAGNRGGLGQVGLKGVVAFGGFGIRTGAGGEYDCVALASEGFCDGGADAGAGPEDEEDGVGGHSGIAVGDDVGEDIGGGGKAEVVKDAGDCDADGQC